MGDDGPVQCFLRPCRIVDTVASQTLLKTWITCSEGVEQYRTTALAIASTVASSVAEPQAEGFRVPSFVVAFKGIDAPPAPRCEALAVVVVR